MSGGARVHWGGIGAAIFISLAVAGYFTGLQAPMGSHYVEHGSSLIPHVSAHPEAASPDESSMDDPSGRVIPATHYADMADATRQWREQRRSTLPAMLPSSPPVEEIVITPADKRFALAQREMNRAFNGAPPTVPHPTGEMSAESCLVCHGQGFNVATLRASKMSHQFLDNCTQCHVESNPVHMPPDVFRESTFVGLAAPTGGPRAYPGAPPQIPHTTWMRVDFLSCDLVFVGVLVVLIASVFL